MRFVIVLTFGACLLASAGRAEACTCVSSPAACEAYWKVPAVFLGRVDSITRPAMKPTTRMPMRRVKFTVLEAFRGVSSGELEVQTGSGGGDCGYNFIEGAEYIVYAYRNEARGVLMTGICSRTRRASDAAEDLAYARALMSGTASPGRISGTVTLADRSLTRQRARDPEPVAGVNVRLEKDGGTTDVATDSEGNFVARGLSPGTYSVSVDASSQYYAEIVPKAVELLDSNGCAEVGVTLRYDGHVSGRIIDGSGRPIPGLTIELTVPTGLDSSLGPDRIRVLSDANGRYELTHVPPGTFIVAINTQRDRDGGLPQPRLFYPGVDRLAEATRVPVAKGEHVELLDFMLPRQIAYVPIRGIVLEADGSPASGARVFLKGPAEHDYILTEPAVTDASGRFVLAGLDGRQYRLFAERSRGEGSAYRLDSSEQLMFAAAVDLSPFKIVLRRRY